MADVTISQLNTVTPLGSHVLPYSDYSSTKKAVISALPVDYTSIVNSPSRALIVYDVPSGTNGGVALNNQWRSRPINTIVYNQNNIVKELSTPGTDNIGVRRWFLDPGNYIMEAEGVYFNHYNFQCNAMHRIINTSQAGSVVASGLSNRCHDVIGASKALATKVPPTLVSINVYSGFELQYWLSETTGNTSDLGFAINSGQPERYAYVYITKV